MNLKILRPDDFLNLDKLKHGEPVRGRALRRLHRRGMVGAHREQIALTDFGQAVHAHAWISGNPHRARQATAQRIGAVLGALHRGFRAGRLADRFSPPASPPTQGQILYLWHVEMLAACRAAWRWNIMVGRPGNR